MHFFSQNFQQKICFTFFFNFKFLFTEFVLIVWIAYFYPPLIFTGFGQVVLQNINITGPYPDFFLRGCVLLKSDFNSDYLFLSPISTSFIIINANLLSYVCQDAFRAFHKDLEKVKKYLTPIHIGHVTEKARTEDTDLEEEFRHLRLEAEKMVRDTCSSIAL